MFKNLVWILFLFIIGVSSSATATQRPILNSTLAGGTYPWDTARADLNNNFDDLYIHWTLITVTSPVDLDTMDALTDANVIQISELVTLSGVPAHSTDLGTFPGGTTIPDNSDNKEALAALEVAVEAAGPGVDENYVTDAELVTLGNQSGTNSGDATVGTANGLSFAGQVLSLAAATNGNPGAMTAAFVLNIESLITLSGVLADATDLGTFPGGTTIPDNSNNKEALAALEIAVEAGGASTWGAITGTLANQTDLQSALDAKADLNGTQAIVTTDSVTAAELIVLFVDNEAGVIWTDPNTNYVPVAGTYGIVPEADGLKQIVNGVKSAIGGGGSGVIATVPTYRDAPPCTRGEYSYSVDGLTKYDCVNTDTWFTSTLVDSLLPTPIIPVVSGVTIDGTALAITYDVNVTQGTGYTDADLNIDGATMGNDVAVVYDSGDGTTVHNYIAATAAIDSEVINLDFLGRVDGLESSTGGDLVAFTDQAVTNNTAAGGTTFIDQNMETAVTGFDNGETWIEAGTYVDVVYTPALRGTQSLALGNQAGAGLGSAESPVFTGTEIWGHKRIRFDGTAFVASNFINIRAVDDTELFQIYTSGTGQMATRVGGAFSSTDMPIAVNDTDYHIWYRIKPGTGDAEMDVWVGTTTTRPALPDQTRTGGTTVGAINYLLLEGTSNADGFLVVDQMIERDYEFTTVDP